MSYSNRKNRLNHLLESLPPGMVFRMEGLEERGLSKDRHRDLKELLTSGLLTHAGPGLYYKPKKLGTFAVPADSKEVLKKFLRGGEFLVRHLSDFNKLGLGTTQHTTSVFVYNKKRVGDFELDGKMYQFRVRKFPRNQTDEFLLVDMLNNLGELGEDRKELLGTLEKRLPKMELNMSELFKAADKYGKNWVKRYLKKLDKEYGLSS